MPEKKSKPKSSNDVLKYSGMAFQMALILAIGAFLGSKLDAHFGMDKPYLTALCAILAFPIAFYVSVKDLL